MFLRDSYEVFLELMSLRRERTQAVCKALEREGIQRRLTGPVSLGTNHLRFIDRREEERRALGARQGISKLPQSN